MSKNNGLEDNSNEEYAKEYTSEEKLERKKNYIVLFITIGAVLQFICIPLLAKFSMNAHNIKILGISGTEILLYGIFIGMPLVVTCSFIPLFIKCFRSIKQNQYPPKEYKVWKKTKIIKGKKAIAKGIIILLSCFIAIVPITVLGYMSLNSVLNYKNNRN